MADTKALEATLINQHDKKGKRSYPTALLKKGAAAPNKGSNVTIAPGNGFEYVGKATEVVSADGETMVEFADGLKLVPQK